MKIEIDYVPVHELTISEWTSEYNTGIRTTKEMQKQNISTEKRRETNKAAVVALMGMPSLLSGEQARQVITMIAKGNVPGALMDYAK